MRLTAKDMNLFNKVAEMFFEHYAPGQRTLQNLDLFLWGDIMLTITDFSIAIRESPLNTIDGLGQAAFKSKQSFDTSYPEIADLFLWDPHTMESIGTREDAAARIIHHPRLTELAKEYRGNKRITIGVYPEVWSRGRHYIIVDSVQGKGYMIKTYQGGEDEKKVLPMVSGRIGPVIFSLGNSTHIEEYLGNLNLPKPNKRHFHKTGILSAQHIAESAAYLQGFLHANKIIYGDSLLHETVIEVMDDGGFIPWLVDYGGSKVYSAEEMSEFDTKSAKDTVLLKDTLRGGLHNNVEEAMEVFERTYELALQRYSK